MTTLSEWLKGEGLLKCHVGLRIEGVENKRELLELTDEDYHAIGVVHNWGRLLTRRLITVVRSRKLSDAVMGNTPDHPTVRWPKREPRQMAPPPAKVAVPNLTFEENKSAPTEKKPAGGRRTVSLVRRPSGSRVFGETATSLGVKQDDEVDPEKLNALLELVREYRLPLTGKDYKNTQKGKETMVAGCLSLDILDEDGTPYTVVRPRTHPGIGSKPYIVGPGSSPFLARLTIHPKTWDAQRSNFVLATLAIDGRRARTRRFTKPTEINSAWTHLWFDDAEEPDVKLMFRTCVAREDRPDEKRDWLGCITAELRSPWDHGCFASERVYYTNEAATLESRGILTPASCIKHRIFFPARRFEEITTEKTNRKLNSWPRMADKNKKRDPNAHGDDGKAAALLPASDERASSSWNTNTITMADKNKKRNRNAHGHDGKAAALLPASDQRASRSWDTNTITKANIGTSSKELASTVDREVPLQHGRGVVANEQKQKPRPRWSKRRRKTRRGTKKEGRRNRGSTL